MTSISDTLTQVADTLCGYPLFIVLIGGGLFLFLYSGMVSVRRLPDALAALRQNRSGDAPQRGISSAQALLSVVAATVGMGNIAGVAIALAMGGPGAIFWMWISAIVGMSTKYHEGVLAILHRSTRTDGTPVGGPMHIITSGLGRRWRPLAVIFAIAGMFGTLCIINANQLAEALATAASSAGLADDSHALRLSLGILMAPIVGSVVNGDKKR
ncbi:sodium/alanine symporter, partial [Paramuribaculum intestinale]|uniref:alanine:cation symporter family protein n=1 Tax=Paramuribaculum intestinale TaxID=2094151 RepID=UPI000D5C6F84